MENENQNQNEITLNLNADAVRVVLALVQHSLSKGGAIDLSNLNTINNFVNGCLEFLREVEVVENANNEETIEVEQTE